MLAKSDRQLEQVLTSAKMCYPSLIELYPLEELSQIVGAVLEPRHFRSVYRMMSIAKGILSINQAVDNKQDPVI